MGTDSSTQSTPPLHMTRNTHNNAHETGRVRTRAPSDATTRTRSSSADEQESESEQEKRNNEKTTCPECTGKVKHDPKRGEHACMDCGLVIDDQEIDHGPEWRAFDSREKNNKSRVGSPVNKMMHDDGLSTQISWQNKDAYGNSIGAKQRKKMQRLRKWDRRAKTQNARERNLRHALGEIDRMASALGLPRDVREIASMIYRQCLNKDMLPGRSIEGMATASLYAASRMEDIPRSLKEMERVSRVDEKEIGRAYRYIDQELGLGIGPSDPLKYIPRFVGEFDSLTQETERLARHLVEKVKEAELHSGKTPPGIAAAAIYMAAKLCNETPTQRELAEVTGVTEVTIRERYQDIMEHGDEEWIHVTD